MEKISVIVPTYNRLAFLQRALRSVESQTYSNWELIVVDDGSTDDTADWLEQYRSRWRLPQQVEIISIVNQGISRARNIGAAFATSDWLAFLDSDDEWLPEKLAAQSALMGQYEMIHSEEIWVRNGVRVNPAVKHVKGGGRQFLRSVDLCCISPSTVLIRRPLFTDFGGFDESFPVCEDYDLWLKVCFGREIGFISEPLTLKYGGHADQLSMRYHSMDYWRIKSLMPWLSSERLSLSEHDYIRSSVSRRCEILLRGASKRQNSDLNVNEIQKWKSMVDTV
jgi:glycosyltransferase involved in cell wall biosynthesis